MKYISEKGVVEYYNEPSFMKRSLNFWINNPCKFNTHNLLKSIQKADSEYLDEIRFNGRFKKDGKISHNYNLTFRVPKSQLEGSRLMINRLMVKIEDQIEKDLDVAYVSRHKREWMELEEKGQTE